LTKLQFYYLGLVSIHSKDHLYFFLLLSFLSVGSLYNLVVNRVILSRLVSSCCSLVSYLQGAKRRFCARISDQGVIRKRLLFVVFFGMVSVAQASTVWVNDIDQESTLRFRCTKAYRKRFLRNAITIS
jgi:hypothetical protein